MHTIYILYTYTRCIQINVNYIQQYTLYYIHHTCTYIKLYTLHYVLIYTLVYILECLYLDRSQLGVPEPDQQHVPGAL